MMAKTSAAKNSKQSLVKMNESIVLLTEEVKQYQNNEESVAGATRRA